MVDPHETFPHRDKVASQDSVWPHSGGVCECVCVWGGGEMIVIVYHPIISIFIYLIDPLLKHV